MKIVGNLAKFCLRVNAYTKQTTTSDKGFTHIKKHTIGDVILDYEAEKSHQDARPDQHARKGVGDFVFDIQFTPADVTIFVVVY